jgi:hypothetical protein
MKIYLLEDNPFDYFLQSTNGYLAIYILEAPFTQQTLQATTLTMSTCVWQRYDPQYCHQRKLGENAKIKQDIINKSNQK